MIRSFGLLSISCFLLLFTSCAKQKSAPAQLVVSLGSLVGATFTGGALVEVVNGETGIKEVFELTSPYQVILPFGTWSLHFVGYEGAASWQGPHACGGVEKFNFTETDQTVQITLDAATCNTEPYLTLKKSKSSSIWDDGIWDTSQWE